MKIRRRYDAEAPGGSVLQCQEAGVWKDLPDSNGSLRWLQNLTPENPDPQVGTLPFRPLSFRDCMLYERHWVQATRGYVKRFMPAAYRLARIYEVVSRRTFPAFRPQALWRRQPIYYFGNHMTIVPSGAAVTTPSYTRALDYELELGWVLSKPLFNATAEEALGAVGGFVVVNDFSARDVQQAEMETGLGPQKSKHFLSSMSQTMVTASEILPRVNELPASVDINGRIVTRTSTRGMRYSVGEVLAHLSLSERLYPGELIASGTLPGGSGIETDQWLQRGDLLRLVIEPIGEIVHAIR
ncbi:MAG TPA: fumarylacetoacetate hydrolase family protein [Terriglobia bacterium]|nr:fumarylacetoacetate hydrolase family protein [Terriglobia bacterium]